MEPFAPGEDAKKLGNKSFDFVATQNPFKFQTLTISVNYQTSFG
jgi:hypothetical protein